MKLKNIYTGCILLFITACISCSSRKGEAERLYVQAVDLYAGRQFDKALPAVKKALYYDGSFFQASLLEAKILYFQDKTDAAEKLLRRLIKKEPAYTEARLWLIRIYIQSQSYKKAGKMLDHELALNPADWRIYHLYSLLAARQGSLDKRLAMEKKAEEMLQDSDKVYIELSDIWLKLGVRETALDYLNKAQTVSSDPESIRKISAYIKEGRDIL
jgi:tetratricopeptide (TPR) repeat protein